MDRCPSCMLSVHWNTQTTHLTSLPVCTCFIAESAATCMECDDMSLPWGKQPMRTQGDGGGSSWFQVITITLANQHQLTACNHGDQMHVIAAHAVVCRIWAFCCAVVCTRWIIIIRIYSMTCSIKSSGLSWCGPNQMILVFLIFFSWRHCSLCGCLRRASSALFSERMDEDACGWRWRMRGGGRRWGEQRSEQTVQPSRRGESEGREKQGARDQGRKKYI